MYRTEIAPFMPDHPPILIFINILAAYESSSPPHRTRPPTQSAPHNQQCVCLRQHTHTPSAADATSRCATSKVATWPTHRYPPHTHSRAITEHRPCETVDLARSTTSCAGGNTPKSRKLKAVRLIQIMSVMAGALLIMPGSSTACALQPLLMTAAAATPAHDQRVHNQRNAHVTRRGSAGTATTP